MEQTESQVSDLQNEYINLVKQYAISEKGWYGRRAKLIRDIEKNLVKQFEIGEWEGPLTQIVTKIRNDLRTEGLTEAQIHYVHTIVQPEHLDPNQRRGRSTTDEEFAESQESVFDQTEQYAERPLSDKQLDKLSPAERKEVLEQEIGRRKSRKTIDNDRIKHLQEYAQKSGITLVDKVTKQHPPLELQGFSEAYYYLEEWERQNDVITNMIKDLKQQVYTFKPSSETQKKALDELDRFMQRVYVPYAKVSIELTEGIKTIMRNITDEKYSDTNQRWMRNAEDKFLAYGNHGSGEVNAVLTNKVILKLGKDQTDEFGDIHKAIPTIVKVPIKRETTREEIGDKTIFEMQGTFDCPNCNTAFPISDEQRDLVAGDLFHQAKTTLLANGLSNAIDAFADNIVYEHVKDPIQWLNEKTKANHKEAIVIEGEPEKIKDVDIDPKDLTEKRHGMLRNAATRRLEKAQHFSDQS